MKRKILVLIAAIAAVLVLPLAANAATVDSGTCGDNVTWTLDDNGTLTISGEGDMEMFGRSDIIPSSYFGLKAPWEDLRSIITKVIIEQGVTSIGRSAFKDCTGLTSINIADSVTSISCC